MKLIAMSLATDLTRRSGRRQRHFHLSIDSQNEYSEFQQHCIDFILVVVRKCGALAKLDLVEFAFHSNRQQF